MSTTDALQCDITDHACVARAEGLRYVSDRKPGITRRLAGDHFVFFGPDGERIADEEELARIRKLAVPPAYRDVWICPQKNGHIQATGVDARGRKQYRYHADWRKVRDETKFHHMLAFGEALPGIRAKLKKHLALPGLPREKVLATVVSLLEKTLIRVGNAEYARDNQSYGLTTMRKKHVSVDGNSMTFEFVGKSGKQWNLAVTDARIARVVQRCADIPGHELFKYIAGDGTKKDVTSQDVNDYLKEIAGESYTAKDFRTWAGTVLAAVALQEFEKYDSEAQAKKNVVAAIEAVSKQLGNTPAICRKCYVHPEVLNAYLDGGLEQLIEQKIDQTFKKQYSTLTDEEVMVLAFLRKRLARK
jgi:DNA topoisomerase-1